MDENLKVVILVVALCFILAMIGFLLLASVFRRARHNKVYRDLDALRQKHRLLLAPSPAPRAAGELEAALRARPGSLAWRAVEEVLLEEASDGGSREERRALFRGLGYTAFYEKRLAARNIVARAAAVDKLGRMGSAESLPKLVTLLDDKHPEIAAVTIRALSRLGLNEGLLAIMERLPALLGGSLVTRKAMETALLGFGEQAVACLAEYHSRDTDPWIMSCVLETLSHLPPDTRSAYMAIEHLVSPNAEVRSKALKVLGRPGAVCLPEHILPLLDDPVWFVRLQAVKTLKERAGTAAARPVGRLLFDRNWRVRSEAAQALSQLGDSAVDVFLHALRASDVYAKESICEEIQRTRCIDMLLDDLGREDEALRAKARDILRIMHGLRFSTPLVEFLEGAGNERIKGEVRRLLEAEAAP